MRRARVTWRRRGEARARTVHLGRAWDEARDENHSGCTAGGGRVRSDVAASPLSAKHKALWLALRVNPARLDPLERARAVEALLRDAHAWPTQEALAKALGKSAATVAGWRALLRLRGQALKWMRSGELSIRMAEDVAQFAASVEEQEALAFALRNRTAAEGSLASSVAKRLMRAETPSASPAALRDAVDVVLRKREQRVLEVVRTGRAAKRGVRVPVRRDASGASVRLSKRAARALGLGDASAFEALRVGDALVLLPLGA